jgi:hypothetical protein
MTHRYFLLLLGWLSLLLVFRPILSFAQAPTLIAHTPSSNAMTTLVDSKVQLTFSLPMSTQAASTDGIRVVSNWRGRLTGVYTGAGSSTISFTPAQYFLPGESIQVTVTALATSQAGVAVANTVTYKFSIGAKAGKGLFPNTPDLPIAYKVRDLAVVDLNKDGHSDLLTACSSSTNIGSVNVRLGDGKGGFNRSTNIAIEGTPTKLAVGDINNDGNIDFVAINTGVNAVSVRLGDGAGSFTGTKEIEVGEAPFQGTLKDVNQDGKLDLLTVSARTNAVSIRLGDGLGGFDVPILPIQAEIPMGTSLLGLGVEDVNRDSYADLVTVGGNAVTVRLGNGKGSFTSATTYALNYQPLSMHLSDVNRDGIVDLLLSRSKTGLYGGRGIVSVRLGDGTGKFNGSTEVNVDADPAQMITADVNNDGNVDLLTGNLIYSSGPQTVSIRLGDGTGKFSGSMDYTIGKTPAGMLTVGLAVADMNEDRKPDLLTISYRFSATTSTASTTTMNVGIRLGDGQGRFQGYAEMESGQSRNAIGVRETMVVDVNNDHHLDLLIENNNISTISVKINNGLGEFNELPDIALPSDVYPYSFAVGDINNDGNVDFVTANYGRTSALNNPAGGQSISVRLGDGQGSFSGATEIPLPTFPYAVRLSDINNDGKLDMVITTYSNNYNDFIFIKLGDGRGGFANSGQITQGVGRGSLVAVTDINNDGFLDLAIADQQHETLYTAMGDGKGNFSSTQPTSTNGAPDELLAEDVNNDNNIDLVLYNYNYRGSAGDVISVYLGDGKGRLLSPSTILLITHVNDPSSLTLADLNSDGFLDAVVGTLSNSVLLFAGDGKGNFSYTSSVPTGSYIINIAACDINNDGTIDLLASCNAQESVSIRLNSGQSSVLAITAPQVPGATTRLAAFPNPSQGSIHLLNAPTNAAVSLFDATGRQVKYYPSATAQLNITGLTPGLYLLRCGAQTVRLIVE